MWPAYTYVQVAVDANGTSVCRASSDRLSPIRGGVFMSMPVQEVLSDDDSRLVKDLNPSATNAASEPGGPGQLKPNGCEQKCSSPSLVQAYSESQKNMVSPWSANT